MRAASDTSWSNPEWMKSANWISAIGRRPARASPIPMPMIEDSASGVSTTRPSPNSAASPSVARNTPPRGPDVLAEDQHPRRRRPGAAAASSGRCRRRCARCRRRACGIATGAAVGSLAPSGAPGVGRSGWANTLRVRGGRVRGRPTPRPPWRRASTSAFTSASIRSSSASERSRCSMRYCVIRRSGSFLRHASTSCGVR